MPTQHLWDQVAEDITQWISGESDWYANAIVGGSKAPFSQELSQKDMQNYYEAQMYNPDGTPNEHGRQQILQRIGIPNYVPLLQELEKKRSNKLLAEPPISATEPQPSESQQPTPEVAPTSGPSGGY